MISDEKVAELKAKHSDLTLLKAGSFEIVVRPPTREEWKRFRKEASDDAKKSDSVEGILRACTVYPDASEVVSMLAKKPALAEKFGKEVLELAAGVEEVEKKAL